MQTFLPYPSFARSAALLDERRLGKQRVEVLQILRAAHLDDYGWQRHPAVLMWRGHARALVAYGLAVVEEWRRRGRADTTLPQIAEFAVPADPVDQEALDPADLPPWLGSAALHRSHRSALLRKDPDHYRRHFPGVPEDLPYSWPPTPAAPSPPRPFSAWVVRAASPDVFAAFRDGGFVTVDALLARPGVSPKQRRQIQRFRGMRAGEAVAVPSGALVFGGRIGSDELPPPGSGPAEALRRPVIWGDAVPRARLLRPYQLQDPQTVFELRGEPDVEAASAARAWRPRQ